jgi:hypothetical protein
MQRQYRRRGKEKVTEATPNTNAAGVDMVDLAGDQARTRTLCGWIGTVCLLFIIPIKLIRWSDAHIAADVIVGIAPSILGPAGLLFLLLSGRGKLSSLSLNKLALLVGAIALGLEFAQLLPRPGILALIHYTFDWLDVLASIGSLTVAYAAASVLLRGVSRGSSERRE